VARGLSDRKSPRALPVRTSAAFERKDQFRARADDGGRFLRSQKFTGAAWLELSLQDERSREEKDQDAHGTEKCNKGHN
jgi:hypothetical protein